MKIVAVSGSLRRGNTLKMVESACEALTGHDVTVIDLSKFSLQFCTGCLECDETHECYIDDDMSKMLETIADAEAYIFASPVRWSLMSGEMKTFFDRFNPFAVTETLVGKRCVLFVVGQSEESGEEAFSIDAGMDSMKAFCENAGIEVVDTVKVFGCLEPNAIDDNNIEKCKLAAQKLVM